MCALWRHVEARADDANPLPRDAGFSVWQRHVALSTSYTLPPPLCYLMPSLRWAASSLARCDGSCTSRLTPLGLCVTRLSPLS